MSMGKCLKWTHDDDVVTNPSAGSGKETEQVDVKEGGEQENHDGKGDRFSGFVDEKTEDDDEQEKGEDMDAKEAGDERRK